MDSCLQQSACPAVSFIIKRQHDVLPMVAVASLPQAPAIASGMLSGDGCILGVLDLPPRRGWPAYNGGITAQLRVTRYALSPLDIARAICPSVGG